jgi:DnaJ like chaperone protein
MPWQVLKSALGMAKGGPLRNALDQLWGAFGIEKTPAQAHIAFTIAVITLAAKMSKADGVSTRVEAETFDRMFVVPDDERDNVTRLFQLASQDIAGYETYARQIAAHLKDEPELKTSVLECLFHVACADGVLHPSENDFLAEVARVFGLSSTEYLAIRRAFVRDPDGPYEVLGVAHDISDAELKAHYRELVKRHHPDTLMSKGVPAEFLIAAERRLAAITTAYDAIEKERGRRSVRDAEQRA